MFFKPTTVASMVAASPLSDLYSDLHKDAFGCRPGHAQWERANAMTGVEAAVEEARLQEWSAEADRIKAMREEVARFAFSRNIEYIRRREGHSELGAFMEACEAGDRYFWKGEDQDWDYLAYGLSLPYSDAPLLKARYEELKAAEAS